MEIALSAVTNAGRSRMAAVSAEVGAHVVLLAVQQVSSRPFHVTAESVLLSDTGEVRLLPLPAASPLEVELELRQLLAGLLGLAPAAPPALKAAAERGSGGGLDALEAELHAALIPINHAAARRALARLFRETQRASGNGASLEVTPTIAGEVTPVPRALGTTPAPASAVRGQGPPQAESILRDAALAEPVQGDLDIDVDVDDETSRAAESGDDVATTDAEEPAVTRAVEVMLTQRADHLPAPAAASDGGVDVEERYVEQHVAYRSDVGELLASFLAHTRSEERMTEELRRMLGVDRAPSRATSLLNGVTSPATGFRR